MGRKKNKRSNLANLYNYDYGAPDLDSTSGRVKMEDSRKFTKCRYGDNCKNKDTCMFYHEGYAKKNIQCKFGTFCTRKDCFYVHPGEEVEIKDSEIYKKSFIMNGILNPESRVPRKVKNKFDSFEEYAITMIENHLSEYFLFYERRKKDLLKLTVDFKYVSQFNVHVKFDKLDVPPNGILFYMFEFENKWHIVQKSEKYGWYKIYNKTTSALLKDLNQFSYLKNLQQKRMGKKTQVTLFRKKVVGLLGYVGNFSANMMSVVSLLQTNSRMKDNHFINITQFLVDPTKNFPGDYTDSMVPIESKCNVSQRKACNSLKNAFEIIQGPPGTGKSTTIAAVIKYRIKYSKDSKVLVTSTRNQALESLIEKIEVLGSKILVFGNKTKVLALSSNYLLENVIDSHERVAELKKKKQTLRNELNTFNETLKGKEGEEKRVIAERINKIKDELDNLPSLINSVKKEVMDQLIGESEIMLCTIASINKIFKCGVKNDCIRSVIVDEAGCLEEISMASVLRFMPSNVLFVGDHQQLPPLVFSEVMEAQSEDKGSSLKMSRSLMERILDCGGKAHTLVEQYRMHRDIMEVVSELFYGGKLEMGKGLVRDRAIGALWVDCDALETEGENGSEIFNEGEIQKCIEVYRDERNSFPEETIKIISFYNGQIDRLKKAFSYFRDRKLLIQSVDASQGSEADCVIISCTRNNDKGALGFLTDGRRINVAISRARECLYVVGNNLFFSRASDVKWKYIASQLPMIK